jgi:ribosomal protein S18 acetylase RimI-like enzyme
VSLKLDQAQDADIPRLVELLGVLFAQEAELSPDPDKQRRALRMILAEPSRARLYVARAGSQVVGMAALHFTVSTAEGGMAAWLEDCVVHPDYRRRGIGKALLEHVLAQARSAGATRVTLLTDGDNARAQSLYRRLGFAASSMRAMRRRI